MIGRNDKSSLASTARSTPWKNALATTKADIVAFVVRPYVSVLTLPRAQLVSHSHCVVLFSCLSLRFRVPLTGISSHKMPFETLYEDEFCLLTEDSITIKRYFFPMLKPKVVKVRDVRVVYFEDQDDGKYALRRTWGRSTNDVYWAVDFRR